MVACPSTLHCPECRLVGIWAKHPNVIQVCFSVPFRAVLPKTWYLSSIIHPTHIKSVWIWIISERLKIGGLRWLGLLGVVMCWAFQVLQWRRWSSGNGHHRRSLAFIDPAQLVCGQSSTTGLAQPVLLTLCNPLLYMQKCFDSKLVKGRNVVGQIHNFKSSLLRVRISMFDATWLSVNLHVGHLAPTCWGYWRRITGTQNLLSFSCNVPGRHELFCPILLY